MDLPLIAFLLWAAFPLGALVAGVVLLIKWLLKRWRKYIDGIRNEGYLEGVQDGNALNTDHAVREALEAERLSLRRRLTDSGRRNMARPDASAAVIHKARIAPAPPRRPDKPL